MTRRLAKKDHPRSPVTIELKCARRVPRTLFHAAQINRMKSFAFFCTIALILAFTASTALAKRAIDAVRTEARIAVDGVLDEPVWQRAGDGDFRQFEPKSGEPASERTEVWVAYDDAALYVAARLHDSDPALIARNFGRRDADIQSDWFWVGIDGYHDGRSGSFFAVNPVGTMKDGILYNDVQRDDSWDGIWDRATSIDHMGWAVEIRIPYSQLRFGKRADHTWGINFRRILNRNAEESHFELMPREEHGYVSRFADLRGIAGIDPPTRLEIIPYVVGGARFLQHDDADPFVSGHDLFADAGADLRLGIGSSFTLDATVNPDFGQVELDPAVLNLSASENYFQEKRPFFVEGSGIFSFGGGGGGYGWFDPTFVYTRRIGRKPQGFRFDYGGFYPGFFDAPDRTTILGAAKLTGKVSEGWSIGALSAATQREFITIDTGSQYTEEVEPLTFYNVARANGEFNEGASGLGFLGTATVRQLPDSGLLPSVLGSRAFVAGVDGYTFLDDQRGWSLSGWSGISTVNGTTNAITRLQRAQQRYYQQPDATHLEVDPTLTALTGWSGRLQLTKRSGNLRMDAAIGAISPGFEANDIGFSGRADYLNWHLAGDYIWFEPDGVFRNKYVHAHSYQSFDFGSVPLNAAYGAGFGGQFENFWGFGANIDYTPLTYDTRSTRGGPKIDGPAGWFGNFNMHSDYRLPVTVSAYSGGSTSPQGLWGFYAGATVTVRPVDQLELSFGPNWSRDFNHAGYVTTRRDSFATATFGARYVFADLIQNNLSAELRINWAFTPELSLQVYAQPFLAAGDYTGFKELARPRSYDFNTFGNNASMIELRDGIYSVDPDGEGDAPRFAFYDPDFNYKSLRGTAVLRWEYLPGSTLYLVWTHNRVNFADPGTLQIGRDLESLFGADDDNIVMLKATYWLNP